MDRKRLRAEDMLHGLGLYRPARAIYGTVLGREAKRQRELGRQFYASLLSAGDLVFDVGANLGNYSEIFSSLGARVVALEPNPDCVNHINRSNPSGNIEVIAAAVGACGGVATIKLADRSDMSSLSDDWIRAIQKAQNQDDSLWARQITVPVVTLDSVIEKYGIPKFIKIDVEGFEESVLDGLSHQPSLLSFEFNTNYLDSAMRCLQKAAIAEGSTFNFVIGEPYRFELNTWTDLNALRSALHTLRPDAGYGDVFVKRA
jgi:FkbM family methyltransferase